MFLFLKNLCIFCGLGDEDLVFLKDFISFNSKVVSLFILEDKWFLVGKCYCIRECFFMFEDLGMLLDIIDWGMLFERV